MTFSGINKHRRRIPVQKRAKATVGIIRQATLDLLREEGLDALNTNAIAERAGISIATFYRYFPDKYSILFNLFETFERRREEFTIIKINDLIDCNDWRGWFDEVVEDLAQFRTQDSAGVALRRALVVRPELQALDVKSTEATAEALGKVFAQRARMNEKEAAVVALVTVETITHLLDSAFSVSPPNLAKVEELKRLLFGYLAPHLD